MISAWVRKDFPFRPGAGRTGDRFGFRKDCIGSPYHAADDRSGTPQNIVMPFDGTIEWTHCGGDFGSLLRIIPDDSPETEIQVAHTERKDGKIDALNYFLAQGQEMPVRVGNLGIGTGAHTHTEWLIRATKENLDYFRKQGIWLRDENSLNSAFIHEHCKRFKLDEATFTERFLYQCKIWGLTEVNTTYCVRGSVPRYRVPQWGNGAIIFADPMLYLDI